MNYTLNIVSHHPDFENKTLRKHRVEGIDTVGVCRDEQFEIRFTNHTWQKVQVKLSLDGIDIMSGELAISDPTAEMWVVQPNSTLSVKAFPESDSGGAALIFSHAGNSVTAHTNGDLSHRGIIACAVFVEGEPVKVAPFVLNQYSYPLYPTWVWNPYPYYPSYGGQTTWTYNANAYTGGYIGGGTYTSSGSSSLGGDVCGTYADVRCSVSQPETLQDQQSLPGIGAGQYVEQKIDHAAGLIKPLLAETIQMRYLWWEELESKLVNQTAAAMHPSGFPADTKKRINLGNTPRIGTPNVSVVAPQPFVRLEP
jgi:hypothetical protein